MVKKKEEPNMKEAIANCRILFNLVDELANKTPNNEELGAKIREIITKYKKDEG